MLSQKMHILLLKFINNKCSICNNYLQVTKDLYLLGFDSVLQSLVLFKSYLPLLSEH